MRNVTGGGDNLQQDDHVDVLFGVLTLGTGGMERRCLLLAHALVQRGWRVGILTLKSWPERVGKVDPRIRVFLIDASSHKVQGWLGVFRLIRRLRPTLYQGFGTLPGFPGAVLARLVGVPVVVNALVVETANYPRWFAPFGGLCFRFAHHAVANSDGVRADYVERWSFPARKITTIPNPIEISLWPFRDETLRAEVRAELQLMDEHVVIGLVARLVKQKGHKYLFDAFAKVAVRHPESILVLVGEGALLKELTGYVEALGLTKQVRFLGLRHDVPRLLQAFDLFCFPSLFEGMPNVVLEAMATGLPVISTTVAGAADLIIPGQTGWLTPIADSNALEVALLDALSNHDRLAVYGVASRRRIEQHFDVHIIMQRYLEFYEQLAPMRSISATR